MTENQKTENKKASRERSAAYPSIPLEQAVDFSIKLETAFGKSPFSRESAVVEMGYKTVTGTSGMRVSALVYYGFLIREGNSYRNSNLSVRISHPIDDNDFKQAIKEAALKPKLYKILLQEFSGRAVPTALSSILIQHHKINRKIADIVANIFRKTIEYAGLYPNGIVSTDLPNSLNESVDNKVNGSENNTVTQSPLIPVLKINTNDLGRSNISEMNRVDLPSGVVLYYPKSLAYSFSMGIFKEEISALEDVLKKELKKNEKNGPNEESITPTK